MSFTPTPSRAYVDVDVVVGRRKIKYMYGGDGKLWVP